ncbi:MAG: Eco57I restriction-modification methylase domain-containing protein [Flavobacteriales bacterium]|nr:Eco57I restriction-modification methylase domain-containing protein [Flavobacteriales bacterium]
MLLQNMETKEFFTYASNKYNTARYKIDTYHLFVERAVKLLRCGGLLGFITPNTFLKNIHAEPLRRFLLDDTRLREIMLFNYNVFSQARCGYLCVHHLTRRSERKEPIACVQGGRAI